LRGVRRNFARTGNCEGSRRIASPVYDSMINRSAFLLIAALIVLPSLSQAQSSQDASGTGTQQGIDCTDPVNAGAASCQLGNGQNGQQPGLSGQQIPLGSLGSQGRGGTTIGLPNGSIYVDNGGVIRNSGNLGNQTPTPPPPEPLTEFQKLVISTTGLALPIFGYDLFRGVPSTFAPVDQIPVTPDYVIGPGDEVRIRVWGQVNFNADVKVDRSGDIYLPQVGRIHVTGVAFSDLSQQIHSQIARVYRNFDLTVDLGELRSIQIFVVGQARRPGAYTVSSLSTLVNALFASGGPSVQGSMRDIQLKREGKVISDFDLYDLLIRGDKSKDTRLLPGDVIFIPPTGPEVALTGSVRKPAIYELNSGAAATSMQQLLDAAGGLSTIASDSRISIERIEEHQARQAIEIALDKAGLATSLQGGDVIRILSIVPSFEKTVTLRGNLANPGRFAWHEGMKLSDLIPDRPSLITRNYWWRRAQLGLPSPEFLPLDGRGPLYQPVNPGYLPKQPQPAPGSLQNPGSSQTNGRQQPNGQRPYTQQPYAQQQPYNQEPDQQPIQQPIQQSNQYNSNSLSQQNSPGQDQNNPASMQGTNGGDASNQSNGTSSAQAQGASGTLAEQQSQVITQNIANAGEKIQVKLSAPEIDWNYAVIERLNPDTLKTSLLSFNLGRLVINHDSTQDLPLLPGDVVTIFSQADIRVPTAEQTKFVKLEGEFVSAGIYSVGPGETLRQLVERAGGLTPNAYLFGSEFTRESTRVYQQQRLDEYVQQLELQIDRGVTALTAQDAAAANAASVSQQGLLTKLHQMRASGRIVLEVKPNSSGLESIPDLPLQDDDRFIVPSVPVGVNVVGSVYDQNSFVYQPVRRVGDYLRLAGGPNRDADKRHIFIIRADGSVFSRETANGLWGNNFEAGRLNPGDSIVVPEKVLGSSALKNFLNWSTVFSQIAFGVAAISVLHND